MACLLKIRRNQTIMTCLEKIRRNQRTRMCLEKARSQLWPTRTSEHDALSRRGRPNFVSSRSGATFWWSMTSPLILRILSANPPTPPGQASLMWITASSATCRRGQSTLCTRRRRSTPKYASTRSRMNSVGCPTFTFIMLLRGDIGHLQPTLGHYPNNR